MRRVLAALLVLVGLVPATLHAAPAPAYASLDAATDLARSYVGARYYASQTGRFTSVDPGHVGGDILNPQSWNGYSYAVNNPLRFVDSLGTRPCEITLRGVDAAAAGVEDGGTVQGECVEGKNPSAVNRRSWFAGAFSDLLDVFTGTAVVGAPESGTADLSEGPQQTRQEI